MSSPQPPTHYILVLFPSFQLLDVTGPLDILNQLSTTYPPASNLTLTILSETLDPVPTKPIPPKSAEWIFDTSDPSILPPETNTKFNQYIVPDYSFSDYLDRITTTTNNNNPLPKPDVLIIPGGLGTRLTRIYPSHSSSSSSSTSNNNDTTPIKQLNTHSLHNFLLTIHPFITHSIITICTGSDLLARTGLLDHRRATTNMGRWEFVTNASTNKKVRWEWGRRWVRSLPFDNSNNNIDHDGNDGEGVVSKGDGDGEENEKRFKKIIYTSAGISAGIDVTLGFIADVYGDELSSLSSSLSSLSSSSFRGEGEGEGEMAGMKLETGKGIELSRTLARRLEYDWREIGEGVIDPLYRDLGK